MLTTSHLLLTQYPPYHPHPGHTTPPFPFTFHSMTTHTLTCCMISSNRLLIVCTILPISTLFCIFIRPQVISLFVCWLVGWLSGTVSPLLPILIILAIYVIFSVSQC
ncbi:unnamed protein product [Heterobilharzia americana]|nr:unnamed protein product [Heterobilharzia americana]